MEMQMQMQIVMIKISNMNDKCVSKNPSVLIPLDLQALTNSKIFGKK